MAGQKRTRSGAPKPQDPPTTATPPCGQASQPPKSSTIPTQAPTQTSHTTASQSSKPNNAPPPPTKRPLLPVNTTIHKRPLLHPAIPSPFAAAPAPKILYITASSAFIPTCKRIRSLLSSISQRRAQALEARSRGSKRCRGAVNLKANGRLAAADVEAGIADAAKKKKGVGERESGEEVFLKATGRAIPRALELGVRFQAEEDCRVRVELGSVQAIDDVEIKRGSEGKGEGEGSEEGEEVPETRIRTLSTVTVCIGLA